MALLSIPPWSELYDVTKNDIVTTTSNTALNGKLYVKIISVLEGQALQDVISWSHVLMDFCSYKKWYKCTSLRMFLKSLLQKLVNSGQR